MTNEKITKKYLENLKKQISEAIEDYNDDDVDFNADFNGGYSSVSQQKKAAADIIQADELKTKNAEFISKFVPKIKNGLNEILSSVETQFEPGKMPKVFGYALRAISKALDNAASEQLIVPIKILTAAIDKAVSDADIIFKKNNTNPVNDKKKSFGDWLGDKLVGNSSINSWFNGPMSVRLNPKTKNIEYVQIRFSSPITLSRDYKDGFWYSSYQLKHGIGDKQMQEFTEMVSDAFPGNAKVESYYNFHNGLFFNFFIGKSGPAKFKRANWYFESNELNSSDKVTMTFGQLKKLIKESRGSGYYWTLDELYRTKPGPLNKINFIADSETIFDTVEDAYVDGLNYLETECPDEGYFKLYVLRTGDEPYGYDAGKKIKATAIKKNGRIIEDHVYGHR